ncbi:MAG: hypothetical protein ACD_67C00008G0006 [uncultured bacterium]|nr:MAG: hypothetical protein ACD_67C00008G0006 [uncultured bacterium]
MKSDAIFHIEGHDGKVIASVRVGGVLRGLRRVRNGCGGSVRKVIAAKMIGNETERAKW